MNKLQNIIISNQLICKDLYSQLYPVKINHVLKSSDHILVYIINDYNIGIQDTVPMELIAMQSNIERYGTYLLNFHYIHSHKYIYIRFPFDITETTNEYVYQDLPGISQPVVLISGGSILAK